MNDTELGGKREREARGGGLEREDEEGERVDRQGEIEMIEGEGERRVESWEGGYGGETERGSVYVRVCERGRGLNASRRNLVKSRGKSG